MGAEVLTSITYLAHRFKVGAEGRGGLLGPPKTTHTIGIDEEEEEAKRDEGEGENNEQPWPAASSNFRIRP